MEKLICKRNALIARVKAELSVVKDLHLRKPSRSEVMDRLDQLKETAVSFRAIQAEIEENQEDPAAIASVFNVREDFFGAFYKARDALEDLIEEEQSTCSQRTNAEPDDWREAMKLLMETQRQMLLNQSTLFRTAGTSLAQNGGELVDYAVRSGEQASSCVPQVRLPAINIPPFNGERKNWMTFKDLYVSTIHNRKDISDSLKMQYLFSYLEGDAKQLVNKFTISSANYANAWDTLTGHYDKKRYTVFALVREFMDQPGITQASSQSLNKLASTLDEVVQQLDTLGIEYQGRDPWLIYLTLEKLDNETRAGWSEKVVDNENPTFEELMEFVKKRCEMLETCSAFSKKATGEVLRKEQSKVSEKKVKALVAMTTDKKCAKCSSEHATFVCEEFKKMNLKERRGFAQEANLCFNCLRASHSAKSCLSKSVCRTQGCGQRHHTLLCPNVSKENDAPADNTVKSETPNSSAKEEQIVTSLTVAVDTKPSIPVFPTAVVQVRKDDGTFGRVRVLIDSGAQASMVTEDCVRKLGLVRRNGKVVVTGIGQQAAGTTRGVVTLHLASRFNENVVITTSAYVLGKLTSTLPSQRFNIGNMKLLENVKEMADPTFNKPGPIDVILGADVFLALLEGGQVKDESGQTVAQSTVFGWIAAGRYDEAEVMQGNHAIVSLHTEMDLNRTLQQFWEYEEIFKPPPFTPSETKVIEHFDSTTQRDATGRFIVKLPFDDSKPALGESLSAATKRLMSMERRFAFNPEFHQEYVNFMREYLELNHMELVPADQLEKQTSEHYYLPHHAVIKADSSTTKLRVVFDGSCGTSTGVSLNDRLLAGPNINTDLLSVLLRFRSYKVAFSADIAKMYRQVVVSEDDRDFQRVVWRENTDLPIQHYRLSTVTYGTKTAPYLAIRAMRESAKDYTSTHPAAVERIVHDFYVDDLLSGANNEEEAACIKQEISDILSKSGFELRKWASSCPNLVQDDSPASVPVKLSDEADAVKALGIHWYPNDDQFGFKVNLPINAINTKRQMISDASKLFDPFGWLAPVIVKIKILYQYLWLYDVNWDDPLPTAIESEWVEIKQQLRQLETIRIPRFVTHNRGKLQLHGFSDSSEQAYAAVVYSRCIDDEGNITVVLVAAKSRVAPIKQVSLPRLELNGALLLTELMKKVSEALPNLEIEHFAWTDSTIVLQWLSSHPRSWKTYVANRTSAILEFLPRDRWRHVNSESNPADCASRGISPSELVHHKLWFHGPEWLSADESEWPSNAVQPVLSDELPEARNMKIMHTTETSITPLRDNYLVEQQLLERRSRFNLIVRSLACVNRFVHNIKSRTEQRHTGQLIPSEIHQAKLQLLRAAQHEVFAPEIKILPSGKLLSSKNVLAALHPFLDSTGTIRVGGRLENSDQPYDRKHPVILPKSHRVTQLLVLELHLQNLHAGPTLLTAVINQQFWIVGCQTVVRDVVRGCTRCVRLKGKTATQLMGNLPPARVLATRAFAYVGIDYAGPLKIKAGCVRGVKVSKGYIVVYVCLSTRAVHLEAASDMSTNTFISTLKRFVSRRGYPNEIRSDNGTNFIGADRVLREFVDQIQSHTKDAERYLSNLGIKWVFNPPSAPHMGGIWEAAVKSVKCHLVAEFGTEATTFEDLTTILCQIEACLNSRPLCPLSSNPDSCEALIPGHFLVGQPLNLIPEPDVRHIPRNRLDQWQDMQHRSVQIWSRWKDEYLASLQPRTKWRSVHPNISVGQLVLVKNDNAPPTQWELARVQEVHPDVSGVVRTVTLRRGTTVYQRPIHKLCVLPVN
ncbi:uncharacterized protein LOC109622039 [Aedes albopictus]|uniref:Integrase catalytic domain-containing protein n=1 Tax=Aedes albopictus TaxID=7160 RepID=A0ABM1ZLB6_AEDAL